MNRASENLMQRVPPFLDAAQAHWLAGRVGSYDGNMVLAREILFRADPSMDHTYHPVWRRWTKMHALWLGQIRALEKTSHRRWGDKNAAVRKAAKEARSRLGEVLDTFNYDFPPRIVKVDQGYVKTPRYQTTQPLSVRKKRAIEKAREIDEWVEGDSHSAWLYRKVRGKALDRLPKGADLCWKCGGSGTIPQFYHIADGQCFSCHGAGIHRRRKR